MARPGGLSGEIQSTVLIVSVFPLFLVSFHTIYLEVAVLKPCVDMHSRGRDNKFGRKVIGNFFLTAVKLCV